MTYHIRDVHTVLALEPKFTRPGYSDLPLLKMINIEQGSPTGHLAVPRVSVRCVLKIKVVNERFMIYCIHVLMLNLTHFINTLYVGVLIKCMKLWHNIILFLQYMTLLHTTKLDLDII